MDSIQLKKFRDAHRTCYAPLFSAVYSRTGSFEDAEDLVQEIFMRLHAKIDEVDSPKAWLFGTMRFVLMEHYRKKGESETDIANHLDDASLGYVNGFRDARIVITGLIAETDVFGSELNQSIFELVSVYGFSLAEAARHLGITYSQARWAYSAASQLLLSALKKKGISRLEDLL